ncbi:glycosyltransferase [uncultured Maritimibacter sp.]|uniref:glycosyltransferase n=1 Tax=uncultured Maritimibacter sp. TaxID=991866 RepID=UPI00262DEEF6|nr:glycosyltransferase [uncultured Maritimibacter sp.]
MAEVAIFLPHLRTGGIERNMIRLAPRLEAQGHVVTFLLQRADGDLLEQAGRVVDLGASGLGRTVGALRTQLRKAPVDVVLSATNATNIAALLACRGLGAETPKIVVGEHIPLKAFIETRRHPWLRRWIMRRLYHRAAALVAPSQPILDEHQALLGAACPRTFCLPNPVVDRVSAMPLRPEARRIVTLGRLSPEKDFALAIEVMRRLPEDFTLAIHGEGVERDALAKQIMAAGIAGRVTLAGRTDDPLEALAMTDLFLCTSRVEGFGNAIVEALSLGLPVVSVDCPHGPAILLGRGAGRLVDSRDPEAIAAQIRAFADDPGARAAAQAKGLEVARGYTLDASARAYGALIDGVLSGGT